MLIKGDYFLKGLLKSQMQICFGLFTHLRKFVQLCYKYDIIDVALCSSDAIFAAVCSDFIAKLSFHNSSFSKSVCLLSFCFL